MTIKEITSLLVSLKSDIDDDCRASEFDGDGDKPGMQVTIGTNDGDGWSYQTGDNSFTGGCYGKRHWSVLSLYRDSNCRELAREAVEELRGMVEEEKDAEAWRELRALRSRAFTLWCLPSGNTERGAYVRRVHPSGLPVFCD